MTSWSSKITMVALATAFLWVLLLIVPFAPAQPAADFDSSWHYAMNMAAASHLAFGRDIVWTVGPLAAVYTRQYHPALDSLMLGVSVMVAIAMVAGLATLATPRRRPWLLLLPLLLGMQLLPDAQFMILPLLLVLLARHEAARTSQVSGNLTLLFVSACCALLPYIKRNLTLLLFFGLIFSVAILWQRRTRLAVALMVVCVATSIVGWLVAGQELSRLPGYFVAQGGIISGYTDAMANGQGLGEIITYVAGACLMLALAWRDRTALDWMVLPFLALIFFVCFKMGFVRQDLHVSIAASALGLIGLMLFLRSDNRWGYWILIVGMAGWGIVAAGHEDVRPSAMLHRVGTATWKSAAGLWRRATDPEWLPHAFANANGRLALTAPLPVYPGPSDLYTSSVADLFANGAHWHPRPIVQSTSAYTPELLALNLLHLQNDPPQHIYFRPSPEDQRYPAFEDGESWPQLLRAFEVVAIAGDYAVLGRRAAPVDVGIARPILSTMMTVGSRTPLPSGSAPLWATIQVRPTLLGRLVSLLYKLPPLSMRLTYPDRSDATYRFVPGIASAGFLLSPTVARAEDFVALASPQRERFFVGRYPSSITIEASGGAGLLWQPAYQLTLSPLVLPADSRVDALLLSRRLATPVLAEHTPGGICGFDTPDNQPGGHATRELAAGIVRVSGWAMLSAQRENAGVILQLEDDAGTIQQFEAVRYPRVDLSMYLGLPYISRGGYEAVFDAQRMRGNYTLQVLQSDGNKIMACATQLHVHIAGSSDRNIP
jgi:hypothetical protein